MKPLRKSAGLFTIVLMIPFLIGCSKISRPLTSYDAQYLDYFDTYTSVTIYAESKEQFDEYENIVRTKLEHYHQLFDIYNYYEGINNIKTINDSAGECPVTVDKEIIDLLEFSMEQYEKTEGKVNVAMGNVLSVWHDYREMALESPEVAEVPDAAELEMMAEYMDIYQIVIDKEASTVYLPDFEMRLDVGAVAKGYATEKISEALKEAGVTSALLSLGGNVETIGVKGDGNPWRVGVQDPSAKTSYIHVLKLSDISLVTSGTYQRYYEVEGVRYHHIIHPELLAPWNKYDSVTILCADSGVADALSTAVFNMELEEGKELIESLENTEALWILPDGSEVESSGFAQYVES